MSLAAEQLAQDRRQWALPGSRRDRRIRLLRRLAPLGAAAVLLASLVWPLAATQEFSFVLSKDSVEMAGERLRMEAPMYRGEDSEGRPFSILARRAVQRTSTTPVVELLGIEARLSMDEGIATVTAPMGRYDMEGETLRVSGPVIFKRPDGYRTETGDVTVDLAERVATSTGAISGRVPLGTFSANRLQTDIAARRLVLSGDVKMRITQQ
jgi:lipopolysaccharide export system protein LptC